MVSKASIEKLIESQLLQLSDKKGIIIDGYPRDMTQAKEFQDKVNFFFILIKLVNKFKFLYFLYSINKNHKLYCWTVQSYN